MPKLFILICKLHCLYRRGRLNFDQIVTCDKFWVFFNGSTDNCGLTFDDRHLRLDIYRQTNADGHLQTEICGLIFADKHLRTNKSRQTFTDKQMRTDIYGRSFADKKMQMDICG